MVIPMQLANHQLIRLLEQQKDMTFEDLGEEGGHMMELE